MSQFANQVRRFSEKTKAKMDKAVRKITLDVFSNVILMSPVGNPSTWKNPPPPGYLGGRFRGNWQPAVGTMPGGVIEATDPSGNTVIAKVQGVTEGVEAGDVIYMVNNLPYARRLEDGWSRLQAPAGMVALTVQRFQPIADEVFRQLAAEG